MYLNHIETFSIQVNVIIIVTLPLPSYEHYHVSVLYIDWCILPVLIKVYTSPSIPSFAMRGIGEVELWETFFPRRGISSKGRQGNKIVTLLFKGMLYKGSYSVPHRRNQVFWEHFVMFFFLFRLLIWKPLNTLKIVRYSLLNTCSIVKVVFNSIIIMIYLTSKPPSEE